MNKREYWISGHIVTVSRRFLDKATGRMRVRVKIAHVGSGVVKVNEFRDFDDMHSGDAAFAKQCTRYNELMINGGTVTTERERINVDRTERGTDLRDPSGKVYTVVDFDDENGESFLWLKADGAKRRRKLYEHQTEGWTVVPPKPSAKVAQKAAPNPKLADKRDYVELHMVECRHCDWRSNGGEFAEDKGAPHIEFDTHYQATRHNKMWVYTISRARGEIIDTNDLRRRLRS